MARRIKDPRRGGRFRRGVVYVIASLVLLLLSQRQLHPRPELSILTETVQESQESRAVDTHSAEFNTGGRSFSIRPDQQGVVEFDKEGSKPRWEREFGSIITTAAVSNNLSAWGLLDGRVFILDQDGVTLRIIDPRQDGIDSAYPCVYALAMSGQGESAAMLYGILPQYVLVYERKSGFYSLGYAQALQGDLRSAQSAAFSGDGMEILMHTADGLFYFDRDKKKGALLHPDRFTEEAEVVLEALGEKGFALLTATANDRHAGVIQSGALEAYFPLPPGSYGLDVFGDSFSIKGVEKELLFTRRGNE